MSDQKVYVVLLDDEPSVGKFMHDAMQRIIASDKSLPPNLELIHFKTSKSFFSWHESEANRASAAFYIIDKNLDLEDENGQILDSENGLLIFQELRDQYQADTKLVDYVIFSGDTSLTHDVVRRYFPGDPTINFLEKPRHSRDLHLTYNNLLGFMLKSDKFWTSVDKINGTRFVGHNMFEAV
jgi:hypothetical protein